ncbi:glycoside hydrolase family 9 protein, partial [Candidatus Pacearchaeota archaeon]|nr:glycoside hydrolase family 9 protein [Candidatus Pacearchaeota archaeon]
MKKYKKQFTESKNILSVLVIIFCICSLPDMTLAQVISSETGKEFSINQQWKQRPLSLLVSQLGYNTTSTKRLVLRSTQQNPVTTIPLDGLEFQLIDKKSNDQVYTGTIKYWGLKWASYWWVGDFSELKTTGTYYVSIPDLTDKYGQFLSNHFEIKDNIFLNDLVTIAMDQLDSRVEDTPAEPGRAALKTWRDCGSEWITEISSVFITINALADIYDNVYDELSDADQNRLIRQVMFGMNYLLNCQRTTVSPLIDGFLEHDLQSRMRGPRKLSPNQFTTQRSWHDQANAITTFIRAYKIVKQQDPEKANIYLNAAKKIYRTCILRPYNLDADFGGYKIIWDSDSIKPKENLERPEYIARLGRLYYNKPLTWTVPNSLRTKSKLSFLQSCTLLFEVTNDKQYLDKAVELANQIAERQFVDWQHPIEGVYGNFYEWEGDNDAFMTEYCHSHGWFMGNIEPTNLKGFIDLIRLLPEHQNVAKWQNVIHIYAENFAKKTSQVNPLGIYPVAVYKDRDFGGLKFFENILHGATALYGQIAHNFMEVGDFLNDCDFQDLAENNLQFVVGLNPGFPNVYNETAWLNMSLLRNIGVNSFQGSTGLHESPTGSGFNGFCAGGQFTEYWLCDALDAPKGILKPDNTYWFNEDYLPHSHGYVQGIVKVNNEFTLKINTLNNGKTVPANVTVDLDKTYNFAIDQSGSLIVKSLPLRQKGKVAVSYNNQTIEKHLETLGSGVFDWSIDFVNYVEAKLNSPAYLLAQEKNQAILTLKNYGSNDATVDVILSSVGVETVQKHMKVHVKAYSEVSKTFELITCKKTTPYLVYALVKSGNNVTTAIGKGKILSEPEVVDVYPSCVVWATQAKTKIIKQQLETLKSSWKIQNGKLINTLDEGFYLVDKETSLTDICYQTDITIRKGIAAGIYFKAPSEMANMRTGRPHDCLMVVIDSDSNSVKLFNY